MDTRLDNLCVDSLSSVLCLCYQNPVYNAAIVFNSFRNLGSFMNEFMNAFQNKQIPGIRVVRQSRHSGYIIEFMSGSIINVFVFDSLCLGKKYNKIIIDPNLDDRQLDILRGCLRQYSSIFDIDLSIFHACSEDCDSDTSELDEFLNTFKTIPKDEFGYYKELYG